MSGSWSTQVEQRYALRLPEDVRAWLDKQIWREPGGAEFSRPQTPEQLLDPAPEAIWAGFMLPDTLPIISNNYGDWLCLRIDADGTVAEVLHWSHCGGDWIPYGRTLAEGLLYDAALHVLYPKRASFSDPVPPDRQVFAPAEWARDWIPPYQGTLPRFWSVQCEPSSPADKATILGLLEAANVAEYAVRRDHVLEHVESSLKSCSDASLAEELGVTWEPEFVRWLFDTDHIPEAVRARLSECVQGDGQGVFAQNWPAAEREAMAVIQRRTDLGWAFDIAGWGAERRGDLDVAVNRYLTGMQTSWFSDDTLRFRTHWFEEGYGKFAAARLAVLSDHLTTRQRQDPYLNIFLENDRHSLRQRVEEHWIGLAREARSHGAHWEAYQCYYRAGWDLGLLPITAYDEVFEGLRATATAAGSPALAAIAQLHHRFLH